MPDDLLECSENPLRGEGLWAELGAGRRGDAAAQGEKGRITVSATDLAAEAVEESELAKLIVSALNLEIEPEEIDPESPLYGEGLGLDSIDILEIALAVSQSFGVKLRSDDEDNVKIFSSLRSLSRYIRLHRSA